MEPPIPPSEIPPLTMPAPLPPPALSFWARCANIIAAPGEALEDVKCSVPSTNTWLLPMIAAILVSWIGSAFMLANPAIQQQMKSMMEKAMDQQFASSGMPASQIEQSKQMALRFAEISQSIGAYVGPVIMVPGMLFLWALILWLLGKLVFKVEFAYLKAVEAVGLCSVISVLGTVVRFLLVLVMNNMFASPSLGLLVKNFDPQNTAHGMLAAINLFALWGLAVQSIALARLSNVSFAKAAAWLYGIWITFLGAMFGLAFLAKAIFAQLGHPH
jgi:hypothetical protein